MKRIITIAALALTLGACANARDTRMAEGAVIGGVVAGIPGAVVGVVVADATRPAYRRKTCFYSEISGRRICRYRTR